MSESESRFEALKRYVGFTATDELELAALQGPAAAGVESLLDEFYEEIDRHESARAVFTDPEVQRPRLRGTLVQWVAALLKGPYDADYAERVEAIGHAHVRVSLPQQYMLTAMNIVRRWLNDLCFETHGDDLARVRRALKAVDRILDIELATMLGTYRDDLVSRMQRQERLATIGELSAGIHHELKNPLAAIGASAFTLSERRAVRADPRANEMLGTIQSNVDKSTEIIGDLLSFTRLKEPVVAATPADQLVDRAAARVRMPRGYRLTIDLDPELPPVRADAAQIEQVLVNLLENAVEACGSRGRIRVLGRRMNGSVQLSVHDNGEGIEAVELRRVFEPLFSTRPDGVGLGLSLSRHLVHANTGEIALTSERGEGTTATVTLPL
ncbi:MAG: GHKL domain-containing protein [Proteobacteria bacterium]|nr:GHKL domain-containing protein [Pseudomonadota bacterium]